MADKAYITPNVLKWARESARMSDGNPVMFRRANMTGLFDHQPITFHLLPRILRV